MANNTSAVFFLKPSTARLLFINVVLMSMAYLLGGLLLMVIRRGPLEAVWNANTPYTLIIIALLGLLVAYNQAKQYEIHLANGYIEGPVPFSIGSGKFALDRLDRPRTLKSLKGASESWWKVRYVWSVDGKRIILRPIYYNPKDIEEFVRRIARPTPQPTSSLADHARRG